MYLQIALDRVEKEREEQTGKLDLSQLHLTEIPEEVSDLKHLKTLNLSRNGILDIQPLKKLTNLQELNLHRNQIEDLRPLELLTSLEFLDLNYNQIADLTPLQRLDGLLFLNLNYNRIVTIQPLEKLKKLQTLQLNDNRIRDIQPIAQFQELQVLNLDENEIEDIQPLYQLDKLQSLSLNDNQIEDIQPLANLSNLKSLDISYTDIIEIQPLEKLKVLQSLKLNGSLIDDLQTLGTLRNLCSLDLRNSQIKDIQVLKHLTNLQTLDLSKNQVEDIQPLEHLNSLQSLNLSHNKIKDISFIKRLTSLEFLDLKDNRIVDIGVLRRLVNLQSFDLSSNQIEDIFPLLIHLREKKFLVTIDKDNGQTSAPINLSNNPISNPPVEILAKSNYTIIQFLEDLALQGSAKLYEAKLLIVGDGGAGKTSLARKMESFENEMPKEGEDRTKGIDIQAMPIDNINTTETPFLMNVWDFGGQGYYHSTHQFFLTKRSLYVLINNTRINKTDFNDWLQTISLFSDNSPVILVENEVGGAKSELDLRGLQQYFDNILYVRDADISNTSDGRLQKIISDIQIEIQRLPHVGSELPKQWVKIREQLGNIAQTQAYISDRDFYAICEEHEITENDAIRRLGDMFHDLGIFLHFRGDRVLKRIVILQNAWATKGVYTILDNELVRSQNGYFTVEQAEQVWHNTPYDDLHHELLSLMEKFRLCYRVPYSVPPSYISPNLLPLEKPDYIWTRDQNLIIVYDYDFMPKGLLGMLIVELHRYVKDIKELAWRNGCIFHYENTDAQVIETYGKRKLEIRVRGAHCERLSTIIVSAIDKLNDSFKRIKVRKLIPCPCLECKASGSPYLFDYAILMRRKEKNRLDVECPLSFDKVDVPQMLDAAYNEEYARGPSIRQLIGEDEIRSAIDVFEEDFPDEGTLLLSRYNQLQRFHYMGTITTEEWNVGRSQIAKSLLELSKLEPSQVTSNSGPENRQWKQQLDQKLDTIQSKLEGQDRILNEIINRSQVQQDELLELLDTLVSEERGISEAFATDIITVIERGMTDFTEKVPNAKTIIADWQEASQQLKLAADSKVKLKWTIPFLFMKLEKEVAWNGKDYFRAIKEDIQRGVRGDWSEMFVTKEE